MGSFSRIIGMIPGMNKVQIWIVNLIYDTWFLGTSLLNWHRGSYDKDLKLILLRLQLLPRFEQVTPAQIREAEKNVKFMESMINVMTVGMYNLHSVDIMKIWSCLFLSNLIY
jgi:hypothetical protein